MLDLENEQQNRKILSTMEKEQAAMERAQFPSGLYSENGISAYIREDTDDFRLLFIPREEEILPHLMMNRGETFADVGANVGYYSLKTALENRGNEVKVVAIEAHPETYRALLKNIQCNSFGDNIITINKAATDKKDIVRMYEKDVDGVKMAGNASICISVDRENSISVQCDTLDSILAGHKVDVLKMDIEGAEVMALKGASNVLKTLRKIVVEIHEDNLAAVQSILIKNGFEVTTIPYELNNYVIGTRSDIVLCS
jgi:FkbM family methyltransferase